MTSEKQRTNLQNRSLHKYCQQMADSLDAAGHDQRVIFEKFKDDFNIPWTMEAFKHVFRTVAHAMYPEVTSTKELTTIQIQNVYEAVDRRFSELVGIRHEWPCKEELFNEAMGYSKRAA